jgi:UDP-GlcNAc:undecaprenyl-phosphate GlcNAc-1-phosphate transferase
MLVNDVLIFLGSTVLVVILINLIAPLGVSIGLVDIPNKRKRHVGHIPLVGGIAIFIVIALYAAIMGQFGWMVLLSGILLLVGCVDDAVGLGIRVRLIAQALLTWLMVVGSGVSIEFLGNFAGYRVDIGWVSTIFTIFAVIGLVNAFNMLDGMDGLCAGHAIVSLVTLIFACALADNLVFVSWLFVFLGALLGFWLINMGLLFVPKVFLGDAGSTIIGFIIGWLVIGYTQAPLSIIDPVSGLWALWLPVYDSLAVIAGRVMRGKSAFAADRSHLHHLLSDSGYSNSRALGMMLIMALALGLCGTMVTVFIGHMISLLLFAVGFVVYAYVVNHPEMFEKVVTAHRR